MNDEPTFDPRRKAAIRELVVTNAAAHPGRGGARKRTTLVVTLVLLAVTVSGGSVAYALGTGLLDPIPVAAPTPSQTPTPTVTETPTSTPTATPTAVAPAQDPADPSTWIIGFDSVGPLRLGPPFDSQRDRVPDAVDRTDPLCTDAYSWLAVPGGINVTVIAAADGSRETAGISVDSQREPELAASPKTAAGIGIGSTYEQLQEAYPGIQETGSYSDISFYYGITDGKGAWIVFSVYRDGGDAQLNDTVTAIQIANESHVPAENGSVKTMPSERCPA